MRSATDGDVVSSFRFPSLSLSLSPPLSLFTPYSVLPFLFSWSRSNNPVVIRCTARFASKHSYSDLSISCSLTPPPLMVGIHPRLVTEWQGEEKKEQKVRGCPPKERGRTLALILPSTIIAFSISSHRVRQTGMFLHGCCFDIVPSLALCVRKWSGFQW